MRHAAVNAVTELPSQAPPPGEPLPADIKYMYLPRIRCLDCTAKLYTAGPGMTADNFEVHLKHKPHRETVNKRLKKTSK